jgi:hypothetical protein
VFLVPIATKKETYNNRILTMTSTAFEGGQLAPGDLDNAQIRRKSKGVIELKDEHGRRRTIQVDELTAADRELAEKFGYNPVGLEHERQNTVF